MAGVNKGPPTGQRATQKSPEIPDLLAGIYTWRVSTHVFEKCGGAARTSAILLRRHYCVGRNLDATAGCNLSCREDVEELQRHGQGAKLMVAVMSPPCTSLAGWGPLNASRGSERHAWNRERSRRIGTVCGSVAYAQVAGGRPPLTDSTHEHGRTEGAEARATQLWTW